MILNKINSAFLNEYPYLNNVKITLKSTASAEPLHPLLTFNAGMVMKSLETQNNKRVVIWVPSADNNALWLSTLLSLRQYKQDYLQYSLKESSFKPGQKLYVNGAIVEYVKEEWDDKWGLIITVRYREGNDSYIDFSMPGLEYKFFQATQTSKRLSNGTVAWKALHSVQKETYPIDDLLDITTYGNRNHIKSSITLVSRIGQTENFINEKSINGQKVIDLLGWAKLDTDGEIITLDRNRVASQPSCVITSGLYSMFEYSGDFAINKRVIIDGVDKCLYDLPLFDTLLESDPEIVVISDLSDQDGVKELLNRNFSIWRWNKSMIYDLTNNNIFLPDSSFYKLDYELKQFCNQTLEVESVNDEKVKTLATKGYSLIKTFSEDHQDMIHIKYELLSLVNGIMRMIRHGDKEWTEEKVSILHDLKRKFGIHYQWLSSDIRLIIQEFFEEFDKFLSNYDSSENEKVNKLNEIIDTFNANNTNDESILVVLCNNSTEVEYSESFWKNKKGAVQIQKLRFITIDNLTDDEKAPTQMIVAGWLGLDRMTKVVNSLKSNKITILCYEKELEWCETAKRHWDAVYDFTINNNLFSKILGVSPEELNQFTRQSVEPTEIIHDDLQELIKTEYKLKKHQLSKYITSTISGEDLVSAKPVGLSSNKLAFFTESHKIYLLNEVLSGQTESRELPFVFVKDLKFGDKILFRDSNRDIIREIADTMLRNAGKPDLSTTARLWKDVLRKEYNNQMRNIQRLERLLKNNGYKRTITTLKQWLFDDDQIGPRDLNDLDIIVLAANSEELKGKLDTIKNAIPEVRSAHLQAAVFLISSLKEVLFNKVESNSSDLEISNSLSIDLGQYGHVSVLTVDESDNEFMNVPRSKVNKLLERED